jgi:uncharacterized protein YaeQ
MALTASIYNFVINLADSDRGVYEPVAFTIAQHPSETDAAMVARALAYALEYTEGIALSNGIAEPELPSIAVRDLTGQLRSWIDIGVPDAARLHKASKAAPRVVVYTHKDPRLLLKSLAGERIHRAEALELYALDRELIEEVAQRLQRRMRMELTVTDRHLFVTIGGETLSAEVETLALADS